MIPVHVSLDLDSVLVASDRLRHALNAQMHQAMAAISEDVAEEARQGHAFQNRTGDLEASIQPVDIFGTFSLGTLSGGVIALEDYAEYVDAKLPFLEPAWQCVEPHADQIVQNAVDAAAGEAGW